MGLLFSILRRYSFNQPFQFNCGYWGSFLPHPVIEIWKVSILGHINHVHFSVCRVATATLYCVSLTSWGKFPQLTSPWQQLSEESELKLWLFFQ